MKRSYDEVTATVRSLPKELWKTEVLAISDDYPVYTLTSNTPPNKPRVLIAAGVHGEEPGAVVGLLQWLASDAHAWVSQCQLTVIPTFNPWGYERGIRYAANGNDLNREFDAPDHPSVVAFTSWLQQQTFHLFMDLHEDCDFRTMYLYELISDRVRQTGPTLGERILHQAKQWVPLSHDEAVGDFTTDNGMLTTPFDQRTAAEFSQRPIAIHVYAAGTPHVITVETPGLLPISIRAQIHQTALQEALQFVTTNSLATD